MLCGMCCDYLGIGHAIAVALAEAGAYVVALARNEARLDELKEKVRFFFCRQRFQSMQLCIHT